MCQVSEKNIKAWHQNTAALLGMAAVLIGGGWTLFTFLNNMSDNISMFSIVQKQQQIDIDTFRKKLEAPRWTYTMAKPHYDILAAGISNNASALSQHMKQAEESRKEDREERRELNNSLQELKETIFNLDKNK